MSTGRKGSKGGQGLRTTALVIAADSPLDNALKIGKHTRGTVRILVHDAAPKSIYVAGQFKLDEDHWLVPGMELPVSLDPEHPERFEIVWEAVPSIEDRVRANDTTLADPRGARRRAEQALLSSGVAGPKSSGLPTGISQLAAEQHTKDTAAPDRFREEMKRAEREPGPSGKTRAVVLVATIMASLRERRPGAGWERVTWGKRKAVLSVNVPGREPYAILDPKFNRPQEKADIAGSGLPALVSSTDAGDVETLWDEVPALEAQIGERISDSLQAAQAGMEDDAALHQEMIEAMKQSGSVPSSAFPAPSEIGEAPQTPAGAGAGIPGMGPELKQQMAAGAKQALQFIKDPAQRKMMIQQYRAAGIEIDEEE